MANYRKLVNSRWEYKFPAPNEWQITCALLGLATELQELHDSVYAKDSTPEQILDECGDVLFYAEALAGFVSSVPIRYHFLGDPPLAAVSRDTWPITAIARLCERYARNGKERKALEAEIREYLRAVARLVHAIAKGCINCHDAYGAIEAANRAKLFTRNKEG